jgi:hypothetical protein
LSDWGEDFEVDHLLARCIARSSEIENWYFRRHPVFCGLNRSAGASRERMIALRNDTLKISEGVIFATELQVLKAIGYPVGTDGDPETLFDN